MIRGIYRLATKIGDLNLDMDVAIATRNFLEAIRLAKQGRKILRRNSVAKHLGTKSYYYEQSVLSSSKSQRRILMLERKKKKEEEEEEEEAAAAAFSRAARTSSRGGEDDEEEEPDAIDGPARVDEGLALYDRACAAFFRSQRGFASRVAVLGSTLIAELRKLSNTKSSQILLVGYLSSLDRAEESREIYLSSRSERIKNEIRKLKFQGDLVLYTSEISQVVFAGIRSTLEDFSGMFDKTREFSAFIMWMTEELHRYCSIFRRQVFLSDRFQVITDCLTIAFKFSNSVIIRELWLLRVHPSLSFPPFRRRS